MLLFLLLKKINIQGLEQAIQPLKAQSKKHLKTIPNNLTFRFLTIDDMVL